MSVDFRNMGMYDFDNCFPKSKDIELACPSKFDLKLHFTNEPGCEKTGLRGFRQGRTQTVLYSHRR